MPENEKLIEMVGPAGRRMVTQNEINRMTNKGYTITPPAAQEDRTGKQKKKAKKESEK